MRRASGMLGFKQGAAGSLFGAPVDATPNGRQSTSIQISDGTITTTGTASWWAAYAAGTLHAHGTLAAGQPVVAGNSFTLAPSLSKFLPLDVYADELPNHRLTPGVTPAHAQDDLRDDLVARSPLCYAKMKLSVYRSYGMIGPKDRRCVPDTHGRRCEIDHLIPRSLGGADKPLICGRSRSAPARGTPRARIGWRSSSAWSASGNFRFRCAGVC